MKGKNIKVSSLYGKIAEGNDGKSGYVVSVNCDGGRIRSIVCVDESEKRFAVAAEDIICIGEKIAFKWGACKLEGTPLRLGRLCFDSDGNYAGTLTDVVFCGSEISYAYVGRRKYAAQDLSFGDAVIIKRSARRLLSNVEKDGKVLIKRGTALTPEILNKARENGEYIQTNLKSI